MTAIDESALVDCPDHDFVHGICCSCGLHEADWIGDGCSGCHRTECLKLRERLAAAEACIEACRSYSNVVRSGWVKHEELKRYIAEYDARAR